MLVWKMSLEVAEKFWTLCKERNAQTEEERIAILIELIPEMQSIQQTDRTKEQFLKDLAKNWKVAQIEQQGD